MNEINTKKLIDDFPEIFKDKDEPVTQSLVAFGFEYSDGWFDLTYNMCKEIMTYCNKNKIEPPTAMQMKEKFGGLRFYINGGDNEINKIIDNAEVNSYKTCELCGKPGLPTNDRWIITLCDECKNKGG